eukprot:927301-Amphidinium_carterae.1
MPATLSANVHPLACATQRPVTVSLTKTYPAVSQPLFLQCQQVSPPPGLAASLALSMHCMSIV